MAQSYLSQRLTRPLRTKDGGTLRTVLDARSCMLRISKARQQSAQWARAAQLAKADLGAFCRQVELALRYDGKLDVLRIECTKCTRKGRYSVAKLIKKYGRRANMMKWKEQLNGDCPRRDAHSMMECDLICPDLPKVFNDRDV